jgi:hypothetical protein
MPPLRSSAAQPLAWTLPCRSANIHSNHLCVFCTVPLLLLLLLLLWCLGQLMALPLPLASAYSKHERILSTVPLLLLPQAPGSAGGLALLVSRSGRGMASKERRVVSAAAAAGQLAGYRHSVATQ